VGSGEWGMGSRVVARSIGILPEGKVIVRKLNVLITRFAFEQ
jgi:hypothetical protein